MTEKNFLDTFFLFSYPIFMKKGYVYILTNKSNGVLYIGVTSNLTKRIWEHKNKVVEGFSKTYNLNKLVYFEVFDDIVNAIEKEKILKGKTRLKKINLIENMNPDWKDLYEELF